MVTQIQILSPSKRDSTEKRINTWQGTYWWRFNPYIPAKNTQNKPIKKKHLKYIKEVNGSVSQITLYVISYHEKMK